jgi:hypothetical protein
LTKDHEGRSFLYAADNQLREVFDAAGTRIGNYAYYGDGNRRVAADARFYYDGDQEIAEYDAAWPLSAGKLVRRYVRLPGSVDEPMLMIDYTLSAACTTAAGGAAPCERWAHQTPTPIRKKPPRRRPPPLR